ncbi:hypothetical protein RHSIM_Rhsim01G0289100 [Rhododendron simsii]|uniref:DUF761 domain-containing protein n=1 Tax=Rhododendron simsii TaxID=118357 RepID=A0A834LTV5_RHOSS|nr:hypothetical protein RHSIM_Rhsim01G0289100 [Rhododendron simsii]
MEDKSTTTTTGIIAPTTPTAAKNGKTPPLDGEKNKKKRGAFTLFKAATLLIRRRPEGKPKPEVPSKVTWKKFVGSIRPFHLQDNQSPRPSAHSITASPTVEQRSDDVSTPLPPSPQAIIKPSSANSDDGMSQYGSTTNLQELDKGSQSRYASAVNLQAVAKQGETDGGDDGISNNNVGDEMIDSKAEEFIAKFYQQMRVQHLEKVERYNKMMVARG